MLRAAATFSLSYVVSRAAAMLAMLRYAPRHDAAMLPERDAAAPCLFMPYAICRLLMIIFRALIIVMLFMLHAATRITYLRRVFIPFHSFIIFPIMLLATAY